MVETRKFDRFQDFVSFNEGFINRDPMLYHFLFEMINRVLNGKVTVYKFFDVIGEYENRIVLLLVNDFCLVYANDFSDEMISKLSEDLEFHKFNRYEFAGNKHVIDALFNLNSAKYEMQKHRVIYRCRKVNPNFKYSTGQMQMGDLRRLDELTTFSVEFSEAYYGKKEAFEHMKQVIYSGIINDTIYQWNHNNNICSIAQAINEEYDFPVIGHLYTNPAFRNQGFGASIVHRITKGLLDVGHEYCMLSTDATNPASNRVFNKVGYEQTGEYLLAYKQRR